MPLPTEDEIRKLAEELGLDEAVIEEVEEALLEDGGHELARLLLLGRVDRMVSDKEIPWEKAADFYQRIGFTPEEMAHRRQSAKSRILDDGARH